MNYHNITFPDIENGTGIRVTLWVSGCEHHCLGCHNPETWHKDSGKPFTEETKQQLFRWLELPYTTGITLSGGDPLFNYKDILTLCKEIKMKYPNKNIWLYTGYTYEEILQSSKSEILKYIDILVDGKFQIGYRDISLPFKGSKNQRIIDVPLSLKYGFIILNYSL